MHTNRETQILISRRAILHNASLMRGTVSADSKLCAVLRHDAWGHGASLVAETLCSHALHPLSGPDVHDLAVETFDEAYALGPCVMPTRVLRPIRRHELSKLNSTIDYAIERSWTITIDDLSVAAAISKAARRMGRRARIHWQALIDPDHCNAATSEMWTRAVRPITGLPSLRLMSVSTSTDLAKTSNVDARSTDDSDRPDHWMVGEPLRISSANGDIAFVHYQSVSTDLTLYGVSAVPACCAASSMRLASRCITTLAGTKVIQRGNSFDYGRRLWASDVTTVGVIPVGTAHGIFPEYSGGAIFQVRDKFCPLVGRVALSTSCLDISASPSAILGDSILLLGDSADGRTHPHHLANLIGVIAVDVLAAIGNCIPRQAIEDVPRRVPLLDDAAA